MTRRGLQRLAQISEFEISNSQAPSSSRRRASWAVGFLPLERRGEAERRKAHLGSGPRLVCRIAGKQRPRKRLPTFHRGDFRPWDRIFRAQVRAWGSPSRWVSPPFTCLVQPFKAEPPNGPGRLPRAPRCHACEAWPQAPHPTGPGYPSPAKLPLCPTSRIASRSAPSLDRTRSG